MSEMYLAIRPDGSAYLAHYGVVGMKWGVRHDKEKALGKGLKAISGQQTKADKYRSKAAGIDAKIATSSSMARARKRKLKYEAKAAKYYKKSNRLVSSDSARAKNLQKAHVFEQKSKGLGSREMKLTAKSNQLKYKAAKIDRKSAKLGKEIVANYSKQKLASVSDEQLRRGRAYVMAMYR